MHLNTIPLSQPSMPPFGWEASTPSNFPVPKPKKEGAKKAAKKAAPKKKK